MIVEETPLSRGNYKFRLPRIDEYKSRVKISKWLKKEGEFFEREEEILELEYTDRGKMNGFPDQVTKFKLKLPCSGRIGKIILKENEKASLNDLLAMIDADGSMELIHRNNKHYAHYHYKGVFFEIEYDYYDKDYLESMGVSYKAGYDEYIDVVGINSILHKESEFINVITDKISEFEEQILKKIKETE